MRSQVVGFVGWKGASLKGSQLEKEGCFSTYHLNLPFLGHFLE